MTLSQVFAQVLNNFGYRRIPGSTSTNLRFYLRISSGSDFRSQLILYSQESEMAVLTIFLTDIRYPVSRQLEVYQLANLLNEKLVVGAIVTRLDDGCIYFRNTFDASDIRPSVEVIGRFLSVSAFPLALWEKAYRKLLSHRGTPFTCLEAALIELHASDAATVSAATRRALLELHDGNGKRTHDSPPGLSDIIPHLTLT